MKAIVIGLGSMGRRRIRLLHELDSSIQIIGVDIQISRRKQAEYELGILTCETLSIACDEYHPDIAFISTSPLSHGSLIKKCLEANMHVFSELNLTDRHYEINMELSNIKRKILFLSSTFLYRKEIQFIKKAVDSCDCILSYMYHVGQYLSDWHPWESYKDFFIGRKETNGCRELLSIEIPWLIDAFGEIKSIKSSKNKTTSLNINFADTYYIFMEHISGHKGLIIIDVVSRKAVRNLEISGETLYLTWNGTTDSLKVYDYIQREEKTVLLYDAVDNRDEYSEFIIEDAYKSEIKNFLNVVEGKEKAKYSFEQDKKVLSIIDDIEERGEYLK